MTQKFGRNYRLTIYPIDGGPAIIIEMPFTIRFSVIRDVNSGINRANVDIYNLSEASRSRIFQDRFVLGLYQDAQGNPLLNANGDSAQNFNMILEIGYQNIYRVFYGRMLQASSAREGTNIVTRVEGIAAGIDLAGTQTFRTLDTGVSMSDVFKYLISQFPNLKLGAVGNYTDVFKRPVVLNGNTWKQIQAYSGNNAFIDNGQVYVLNKGEVLQDVTIVDDETGLLDTPRRDLGFLTISTLLEPGVNIGNQLKFQSTVQPEYNGTYKVLGVIHQGTISSTICGHARSIFRLQAQNIFKGFTVVQGA